MVEWRKHDGGPKPAELCPDEEAGAAGLDFCPRIRIVDRNKALQSGFTNSPLWKWRWNPRDPGPGDIVEYAVKEGKPT